VTAAAGLIAGLAAGLVGTVLARRWATEDRAAAWQREDALRWHQDRLQAYVRMISALDAWDAELRKTLADPASFDAAEWRRHGQAVTELLGLVFLMAPEKVTDLARQCYVAFARAGRDVLVAGSDPAGALASAEQAPRATRRLIEAMRADLGLGGEQPAPQG
jgi:hypothetical protein